jgi:FeS assembly protein IscX
MWVNGIRGNGSIQTLKLSAVPPAGRSIHRGTGFSHERDRPGLGDPPRFFLLCFTSLPARSNPMKWSDTFDIAIALAESHPDVDPRYVRFTDLLDWIMGLDGFDDSAEKCSEKVLEAVQMAWMDEMS